MHSDHALALELTPLGTLCKWLEDQQRVCLRRDLAHLERLIRLMLPHDARNRQQLVKLRRAFLSFQRKFAAHLKTEARVIFPLIRQMESNPVGDAHASRSLQTRTIRLERQHFEADEALAEVKALAADETVLFSASSRVQTLRNCLASFDRNLQEQIYVETRESLKTAIREFARTKKWPPLSDEQTLVLYFPLRQGVDLAMALNQNKTGLFPTRENHESEMIQWALKDAWKYPGLPNTVRFLSKRRRMDSGEKWN